MGLEVVVALDVCMATGYGRFRVTIMPCKATVTGWGDCLDR